jgi:Protein of unknown function (DUF5672)/SEC-C motif
MGAKLNLTDVTLLTASSVAIDDTHAALLHCLRGIDFGAVKMLSPLLPATPDSRVQYIYIPPLDLVGYSRLMIDRLSAYVQTSHCLIVQADGFVLDPERWQREFLQYDYIGAPWPVSGFESSGKKYVNNVGNGGFSLRSKKLLEVTSSMGFDRYDFPIKSEDLLICHYLYEEMCATGIRFAPPQLAAQFSIESASANYGRSLDTVFGFHGKHWLKRSFLWNAASGLSVPQPIRRNELCSCGSGKKYKHCHGGYIYFGTPRFG